MKNGYERPFAMLLGGPPQFPATNVSHSPYTITINRSGIDATNETWKPPWPCSSSAGPTPPGRVFEAIANVRPERLLLIADGPRPNKPGEAEACQQVREIVSCVDWPCDVSTNFADQNLGCQERMISGFDWVFSLVEEAILLEDDCLPDPSFFFFCQEMLTRYRNDSRIAMITGFTMRSRTISAQATATTIQISHIAGAGRLGEGRGPALTRK